MHSAQSRVQTVCKTVAAVGLGVGAVGLVGGLWMHQPRPLIGWLIGTGFWMAPFIGLLMLVILLYLFDSGWSTVVRRQAEHLLGAFKYVALAMLPLVGLAWLGGSGALLWHWLAPSATNDPLLMHKTGYLSLGFFSLRSILFLGLWVLLAEFFRRESFAADADASARHYSRCRRMSAGAVVLMALSLTFASIDWFKSLDYHWFSTMYGVWFFAAGMFSALALLIVTIKLADDRGLLKGLVGTPQYYLLGCLLLAFTIFWAYISFSQYLIIYSGNIPEETRWYVVREITVAGGFSSWGWLSVVGLIGGHFLVPFLALLFYSTKVKTNRLFAVAVFCLFMHLLDLYWNILPGETILPGGAMAHRPFEVSLWEVAVVVGLGGLIVASYLESLQRHSSLPKHDPRIAESLHYHL